MLVASRLRWSRAETDAVDHPSTATRIIARAAFHGGDRAICQANRKTSDTSFRLIIWGGFDRPSNLSLENEQMGVPELVREISCAYRLRVCVPYPVDSEEGGEHRQMARHGIVEPGEEAVDRVDPAVRIDEQAREAGAGSQPFRRPCGFQGSDDRGADRDHAAPVHVRAVHRIRGLLRDAERLRIHRLSLDRLAFDFEARDPGMQEDRRDTDAHAVDLLSDSGRD